MRCHSSMAASDIAQPLPDEPKRSGLEAAPKRTQMRHSCSRLLTRSVRKTVEKAGEHPS